jgi:hypothetical protein
MASEHPPAALALTRDKLRAYLPDTFTVELEPAGRRRWCIALRPPRGTLVRMDRREAECWLSGWVSAHVAHQSVGDVVDRRSAACCSF